MRCLLYVISDFIQRLAQSLQANGSLPLTVIDLSENAIDDRGKHVSLMLVFVTVVISLKISYAEKLEC